MRKLAPPWDSGGSPKESKIIKIHVSEAFRRLLGKGTKKVTERSPNLATFTCLKCVRALKKLSFCALRKCLPMDVQRQLFWRPFGSQNRPKVVLGRTNKNCKKSVPKVYPQCSQRNQKWMSRDGQNRVVWALWPLGERQRGSLPSEPTDTASKQLHISKKSAEKVTKRGAFLCREKGDQIVLGQKEGQACMCPGPNMVTCFLQVLDLSLTLGCVAFRTSI